VGQGRVILSIREEEAHAWYENHRIYCEEREKPARCAEKMPTDRSDKASSKRGEKKRIDLLMTSKSESTAGPRGRKKSRSGGGKSRGWAGGTDSRGEEEESLVRTKGELITGTTREGKSFRGGGRKTADLVGATISAKRRVCTRSSNQKNLENLNPSAGEVRSKKHP